MYNNLCISIKKTDNEVEYDIRVVLAIKQNVL